MLKRSYKQGKGLRIKRRPGARVSFQKIYIICAFAAPCLSIARGFFFSQNHKKQKSKGGVSSEREERRRTEDARLISKALLRL